MKVFNMLAQEVTSETEEEDSETNDRVNELENELKQTKSKLKAVTKEAQAATKEAQKAIDQTEIEKDEDIGRTQAWWEFSGKLKPLGKITNAFTYEKMGQKRNKPKVWLRKNTIFNLIDNKAQRKEFIIQEVGMLKESPRGTDTWCGQSS